MHLKKLQLQGFKTFAERTEIHFSEGVTAVVGPNGSGKSNLSDGLLWVLGEQKASAMRGTKAQDVIFAGSDKRKALGMAEVSLTVDNADGTLPVEFAEVTITRRAYRTGEGEYFINKVPCRLKDIYELFLDTGVGRESYALVNQSEIDAVLSVNPEDRRGLFEEAAGIKKYRVRKREALRKLEATEGNLLRVRDIVSEIAGRLEPLRAQAERAQRFIEVRDRLRAIESDLLIVDLRFADYELTAARQAREEEEAAVAKHAARIAAAEARAQGIAQMLADAEAKLETCRLQHGAAMTGAERAESERALAAQRVEFLAASRRLLDQEQEDLQARREHLARQAAELAAELAAQRDEEAALRRQVAERQGDAQQNGEEIAALTRQGERRRAEALALARQQAARQAEAARTEARAAELERSLPALAGGDRPQRRGGAAGRGGADRSQRGDRGGAAGAGRGREGVCGRAGGAGRGTLGSPGGAGAGRRGAVKHRGLGDPTADAARFGGVPGRLLRGSQSRLRGRQARGIKGRVHRGRRCLPDAAGVRDGAGNGAGGELAGHHHGDRGRGQGGHRLSAQQPGRAGDVSAPQSDAPLARHAGFGPGGGLDGVRGAALDIVTFDPKFRPALDVLLGRVFFCDTLDDALRASTAARGWNRVVTLTGEIVLPTGALTGGRQNDRQRANLLGRKTEITSLQAAVGRDAAGVGDRRGRRWPRPRRHGSRADRTLSEAQAARQEAQGAVSEAGRRAAGAESEARRAEAGRAQAGAAPGRRAGGAGAGAGTGGGGGRRAGLRRRADGGRRRGIGRRGRAPARTDGGAGGGAGAN